MAYIDSSCYLVASIQGGNGAEVIILPQDLSYPASWHAEDHYIHNQETYLSKGKNSQKKKQRFWSLKEKSCSVCLHGRPKCLFLKA